MAAQSSANPVSPPPAQNVTAPASQPERRPSGAIRRRRRQPARTHTVVAGETAVRIARQYGVTLDALQAANPGMEPRRMRVGQVLNIPSAVNGRMIPRITFLLIAAFWVAMNVLLWRAEYGSHGAGVRVPVDLVWRKILTAPDISSLTVFQEGQRTGFCEFSTSVEQEMAALDEDKPVPRKH